MRPSPVPAWNLNSYAPRLLKRRNRLHHLFAVGRQSSSQPSPEIFIFRQFRWLSSQTGNRQESSPGMDRPLSETAAGFSVNGPYHVPPPAVPCPLKFACDSPRRGMARRSPSGNSTLPAAGIATGSFLPRDWQRWNRPTCPPHDGPRQQIRFHLWPSRAGRDPLTG